LHLFILAEKNKYMRRTQLKILLVLFFAGIYTIVRYHIFGPVLWQDLPVFTFNKIVIFSALILWTINGQNRFRFIDKKRLLNLIKILVALHILLSSVVIKPYYLKAFFSPEGGLSLTGNLTIWAGIMAALIFFGGKLLQLGQPQRFFYFTILVASHLMFMGGKSWLHPETWYGGMPPITLISFMLVVFAWIKAVRRKKT